MSDPSPQASPVIDLSLPPRESLPMLLGRVLYGSYAWAVFLVIALITLVALVVVPGMDRRRHIAGVASRLIPRRCSSG